MYIGSYLYHFVALDELLISSPRNLEVRLGFNFLQPSEDPEEILGSLMGDEVQDSDSMAADMRLVEEQRQLDRELALLRLIPGCSSVGESASAA